MQLSFLCVCNNAKTFTRVVHLYFKLKTSCQKNLTLKTLTLKLVIRNITCVSLATC